LRRKVAVGGDKGFPGSPCPCPRCLRVYWESATVGAEERVVGDTGGWWSGLRRGSNDGWRGARGQLSWELGLNWILGERGLIAKELVHRFQASPSHVSELLCKTTQGLFNNLIQSSKLGQLDLLSSLLSVILSMPYSLLHAPRDWDFPAGCASKCSVP